MSYQTRLIDRLEDTDDIAPAWRSLATLTGQPMDDPQWQRAAARFVHPAGDHPSLLTVWKDTQLVALAPLMLSNGPHGPRYELIGARVLYEPAAVLARDDAAARRIATDLIALGRPVQLTRIPPQGFSEAFVDEARRRGWTFSLRASGSPFIRLSNTWSEYDEALPSRIRNVVQRGQRQLAKRGQLEVQFTTLTPESAPAVLQEAFEVELRSWKGRAGSAVLLRSDLREFFFHYLPDAAQSEEVLVTFLRLDGAAIAMQVANVSRGAYWQLKIGYDDRYAKYLPGLIVLMHTIKWSYEKRLDRYEFLGVFEPWIREWTQDAHDYTTMLFYPFTVKGLTGLVRDTAVRVRQKATALVAAAGKRAQKTVSKD